MFQIFMELAFLVHVCSLQQGRAANVIPGATCIRPYNRIDEPFSDFTKPMLESGRHTAPNECTSLAGVVRQEHVQGLCEFRLCLCILRRPEDNG